MFRRRGEPGEIAPLLLFFAVVYAVEGLGQARSGIIWQPLSHFLKDARGWSPVEISASLAVLDLPWVVKPLYGLISDFVPLAGFRRRSWLALASGATVLAYGFVAVFAAPGTIIPALVVTSVALAMASTVCGALLVENGQRLNASARFVNQQWIWFNVAQVAAAVAGGWLAGTLPGAGAVRAAAAIAGVAPLCIFLALRLVREGPARLDRAGLRRGLAGLWAAARTRDLWLTGAFLFFYYFSPGFGTPLYFELTDHLRFSQSFIGVLSAVAAVGWIAGGLLYRYALSAMGQRGLLYLSLLAGAGSTLLYLWLDGPETAIAIYFLSGVAAMIANIATLGLAASVCPAGAEGFAFAALMSVINLAAPLSDTIGAVLYERVFASDLVPLIVVSAVATLCVLPLVPFAARRVVRVA